MQPATSRLTLYSRRECHLCEEMLEALAALRAELQFTLETVDVDSEPVLRSRYGKFVPVLVDSGGVAICHYRLDEAALRTRLREAPRVAVK